MDASKRLGALLGLTAAVLFGISPPFAKLMLPESGPILTAGLLYLGAGLGLSFFEMTGRSWLNAARVETPVRRTDFGLLAGVIVAGGMLGPYLMLFGLSRLSGVLTSLLLNLEAPFTVLVAVLLFREHLARLELAGIAVIIGATILLTYQSGEIRGDVVGILAVMGACLCWAIDNNLSQRLSLRDPLVVVRIKTLGAGILMLGLAWVTGQQLPAFSVIIATCVLGLFSYGISLLLDMHALRLIGAAREAGFFATAPFIGAVVSVPVLGERWDMQDAAATFLMMVGVALLFRGHHAHLHTHPEVEHEHLHHHDDHHDHGHDDTSVLQAPHAHVHRHLTLTHDHPHVSELHHRHEH